MRKFAIASAAALLFVFTGLLAPASTYAASISLHGLSITPAIKQLSLSPSQKELTYQIIIDNNQSSAVQVSISTLDFKSLNDTGGLAFIGNTGNQIEDRYGLARWISLPDHVNLPADSQRTIDVTVNNQQDLAVGGHYAAILFKTASAPSAGVNSVAIDQVVSSLLFVSKSGNGQSFSLSLDKVKFNGNWFRWPTSVNLYFRNTGNEQTAPRGIFSMRGQTEIINQNSNLVLPGSARVYGSEITAAKPFWPWVYHASVRYRADQNSSFGYKTVGVVYINPGFVVGLVVLLATFIALNAKLRRRFIRRSAKIYRFLRRLIRVAKLFFTVYLPYRYNKHQKAKLNKKAQSKPTTKKKSSSKNGQ